MRHLLAIALLLSLPAALPAQGDSVRATDSVRAVVEGRIIDPVGAPIAQTEILWQTDRRSVMSRADGSFSLVIPLRTETVILVRRPSYNAQVLRVDLSNGAWRGNLVMQPGSFQLPNLVVDAKYAKPATYAGTSKYDGFFQRRKIGGGSYVTREDIERTNATHTLEILRGLPGLYIHIGDPGNSASADQDAPVQGRPEESFLRHGYSLDRRTNGIRILYQ